MSLSVTNVEQAYQKKDIAAEIVTKLGKNDFASGCR